jgi:hypothetical protein
MNKGFLLSFITLFSFFTIDAQDVDWPTESPNTGANETYLIQNTNLDGASIIYGYVLGAFFVNDQGGLQCAGFTNCSSEQVAMAIWGDDTTTEEKDGFYDGEEITWLAYGTFAEQTYTATVEFSLSPPFGSNTFSTNGLNIVTNFNISSAVLGCMGTTACNYNPNATEDDFTCTYAEENYNCDGSCIDIDGDLVCDIYEILGCTDTSACNYNVLATEEDNTCTYAEPGLECGQTAIIGCVDLLACNYNELATVEGLCIYTTTECATCSGEVDGTGVVLVNDADLDGVCDFDEVDGCTDPLYLEYTEIATDDDGSCATLVTAGCADTMAFNYNTDANTSDNSCVFDVVVDFNTTSTNTTQNYSVTIDTITLTLGSEEITEGDIIGGFHIIDGQLVCVGSTEWTGSDFSLNLWMDDPATEEIDGLTDNSTIFWIVQQEETMLTYLIDLTLVDAPGVTFVTQITLNSTTIIGCMDATAFNYNSEAFINDGTCEEFIEGCTDEAACNYNEDVNTEDGSCYFITASIQDFQAGLPLTVETDATNPIYTWFLNDVEQDETSNEFTPYVNGIYMVLVTDENGCTVSASYNLENIGLEEYLKDQVKLQPNPVVNFVEINSSVYKIETIKLFSITGQLLQEHTVNALQFKIERNNLPKGIYFLQAIVNGTEVTKRVLFK